jgi:tetratricopeptide (TPR) repeat protein
MNKLIAIGAMAALAGLSACGKPPAKPEAASEALPGGMGDMKMIMMPMPAVYAGEADKPGAPVFKGLGDHKHPISTKNPQTQALFDQGVNLVFGFNHAEAIRSFREAARLDPDCAMCWWGVAFALGPNINLPMPEDAVGPAWDALGKARALASKASSVERDYIDALATRYAQDPKADRKPLDEAFVQAMAKLWRTHPEDLDIGTFYAEAMMDTQPWDYWQADAKTPKGHGPDTLATLETIIKREPKHPGALHLYIHAVEASTTPERGEAAADALTGLMPAAGHIVHMPSHLYYRVGRYADAVKANEDAAKVDEAYIASCKAQGYYPAGYYGHNIHFLWTSSEMEGRYQAAIDAARRLVKAVDAENLAKSMLQGELYAFTPVATLVRFGKWDEVLAEPAPPAAMRLDTAVWLNARGFAQAAKHDLAGAKASRDKLEALSKKDFSNYAAVGMPTEAMVKLALVLLDGELARTGGDVNRAIVAFEQAAKMEHDLPYTEPPYWHRPTSHLLGAALLQAGRPSEAEAVYRESLKSYRMDGWALFGLAQALDAQKKTAAAADARKRFAEAWQMADVKLTASRF